MDASSILHLLHGRVVKPALLGMILGFVMTPVAAETSVKIDSVFSVLDTEMKNRHSCRLASPVLTCAASCMGNIGTISLIPCTFMPT